MAKVTLCSDGADVSDQVFTIDLERKKDILAFINLVKHGGVSSGLVKPAVQVQSSGKSQTVSHRNDWHLDDSLI
ncbi:hypothetical protein [Photobacterium lutimaris]|uniref:Uncharacterized protein n=1 Tax=Photobacterium lutimaris TaxID=388278 RepID=A0A2T3J0R0_9GAMM|nr:hypothetical protein [Photobacterium lutimaris]PSU34674.1 hypothetical protein C9I99_06140 [Photobacterium lutimaris]TDR71473.1 hypothetical protein DFP78_1165 [Photobacterium lutimaris]